VTHLQRRDLPTTNGIRDECSSARLVSVEGLDLRAPNIRPRQWVGRPGIAATYVQAGRNVAPPSPFTTLVQLTTTVMQAIVDLDLRGPQVHV
jgi:hypothetical protein